MSVLDDLLARPDQASILDGEVFPELQRLSVRVTDWVTGSFTQATTYAVAKLRAMVMESIATYTATRFGDYVFGFVPLPNATPAEQADLLAWAPIVAKQAYGIDAIAATNTIRSILLTNATATHYSVPAGRIILQFPSGNRYINNETWASSGNDAVSVAFRSEFTVDSTIPRNYDDVSGVSPIVFVTAGYPGVTATNPAPLIAPVAQVGSGLGQVAASGTPVGAVSIVITITAQGNVGAGTWAVQVVGGSLTTGTIGMLANIGGTGITLTPANNGGSPAFLSGDTYYVTAPGSDVTQVGRDAETPQALGTRCRAVFPLLTFVRDSAGNALPISPPAAAYEALVLTAFDEVTVCLVATSATLNDSIDVTIGTQGAPASTALVAKVQAYLDSLEPITDRLLVAAPPTQAITLAAGTVKVKSAQAASAKATAQTRVTAYLTGVDPASPLPYGGLIDRSYLISLIRTTPGVTHVDDALTINGSAADYQLAARTMATYSGDVGSSLTWVTE